MTEANSQLENGNVEVLKRSPVGGFLPARKLSAFGGLFTLGHDTQSYLAFALGALVVAGYLEWPGYVSRELWASGEPTETVAVEDTVERTYKSSPTYFARLKVLDREGAEIRFWASAPELGTTPEVRKTADNDYVASWQVTPWGAGTAPALIGLVLLVLAFNRARRDLATRRKCLELARSGDLVAVSGAYSTLTKSALAITESCSLEYQGVMHVQAFDYFSGGPLRLAKAHDTVVALAGRDGALHALRNDGFPLAEVPAGVACSAPVATERQLARRWLGLAAACLVCAALLLVLWFKLNSLSPSVSSELVRAAGNAEDVSATASTLEFRIGQRWFRFFLEGRDDPSAMEITAGEKVIVDYSTDDVTLDRVNERTYFEPYQVEVDGSLVKSHEAILKGSQRNLQIGLTIAEFGAPFFLWLGITIGASTLPRSGLWRA